MLCLVIFVRVNVVVLAPRTLKLEGGHGWLLHNVVEASFDLFRYLLLGDQLEPWDLHPLVS